MKEPGRTTSHSSSRLPPTSARILSSAGNATRCASRSGAWGSFALERMVAAEERDAAAQIESLRIAHDFFSDVGMEAFAERASIELRATGEQVARERTLGAIDQLTPQRRRRFRASSHRGTPTARSPRSSSSARAPWSTTSGRCSGSWTLSHGRSSPTG
jgi:hypothetical protein